MGCPDPDPGSLGSLGPPPVIVCGAGVCLAGCSGLAGTMAGTGVCVTGAAGVTAGFGITAGCAGILMGAKPLIDTRGLGGSQMPVHLLHDFQAGSKFVRPGGMSMMGFNSQLCASPAVLNPIHSESSL